MKMLDRSRSFATIHGITENNAKFVQDDLEFDVNEVCLTTAPATPVAAAALASETAEPDPVVNRKQLAEQIRLMGGTPHRNDSIKSLQAQILKLSPA